MAVGCWKSHAAAHLVSKFFLIHNLVNYLHMFFLNPIFKILGLLGTLTNLNKSHLLLSSSEMV